MKKASHVLFLVGAILTIFLAIMWFVLAIIFSVAAGYVHFAATGGVGQVIPKFISEFIESIIKANPELTTMAQLDSYMTGAAVMLWIVFLCSVASVVLSFICKAKDKRGLPLLIVTTVFCIMGGSYVSVVGGVLGIVSWAVFERKEEAQA